MMVDLPESLEIEVKTRANLQGVSPAVYVRDILQRELAPAAVSEQQSYKAYKTGYGSLAKFGNAPSEEEIDANRAEMFRNFGREI